LICGGALQLLPWELLVGEVLLRYLGIGAALQHENRLRGVRSLPGNPHFVCFASEVSEKALVAEETRRRALSAQMLAHLHAPLPSGLEVTESTVPISPFQSPLVKYRRKHKGISFVDSFESIRLPVDKTADFIVYLLSYADLVESEPQVISLIR
jgi:hypothetical protein